MSYKNYIKGDYYKWGLRPENSLENLRKIWTNHDWDKNPNEWIPSEAWLKSFLGNVISPFLNQKGSVLEIGCGDGRWSKNILPLSSELILVDIVPYCIEKCKRQFSKYSNVSYHLNDGCDLSFVNRESVDFIISIDVFIQISSKDILNYLHQISRVLKQGGKGLIHHSKNGERMLGWRSDMNAQKMCRFCEIAGLEVVEQFDSWEQDKFQLWPGEDIDIITIFKKP